MCVCMTLSASLGASACRLVDATGGGAVASRACAVCVGIGGGGMACQGSATCAGASAPAPSRSQG